MAKILSMPLSDADARKNALDAKRSFIVEAPAGSGKTGLLIQRYLKLLAEGDVAEPEEVLAITFTRKATAELRHRILKALRESDAAADESTLKSFQLATRRLAQAVLARDRERGWDLLRQPQRLKIRTIDSLCYEIAQHLPLLSGLGGNLSPIEDAKPLYKQAARRTLAEIAGGDATLSAAVRTLLLHRDGRLGECERMLAEMLAKRDEWARLLPASGELNDPHLNGVLRPRLEAMVRELLPDAPLYSDEEWELLRACMHLLRHAIAHLRIAFAARGQCDFTEISLAAIEALEAGGGELAMAMGVRFKHLLVDEMQDTSLSQYVLLERLTAGWDGYSQTVFLVGDPRQSIYLFRMARVERFTEAIQISKLGDVPVTHLLLTANFRSHPLLVDAFNTHFEKIRPDQIDGNDVTVYRTAHAGRTDAESHSTLRWHTRTLASDDRREAETAEAVAVIQAAWQRIGPDSTRERPPIAVLVRVKHHAMRIAAALRQAHIPYRASEIESLADRQEVLDALSLLRALLHPADRMAWFAVLRAPWCGLSVHDLHILSGADDASLSTRCIDELITERASLLEDDGRKRAVHVQAVLHAARAQAGRSPVAPWLRSAWHTLGAPLYLDAQEIANVEAFFDLAAACEDRGEVIDANLLLQRLDDLCAQDLVADNCAVEIMTIHKAKGLEWDVVIVPGLDRRGRDDASQLLHVLQQGETGLLAPISPKGGDEDSLHRHIGEHRRATHRLELRRLFYVAATRAREELHLFAQLQIAAKGGPRNANSNSLLHAAWPAAEEHFRTDSSKSIPDGIITAIAAAEAPRTVRRIASPPLVATLYAQHAPAPLPTGDVAGSPQHSYQRTEGSLSSRALGTVVHAYLDKLAGEFAAGKTLDTAVLDGWLPGITAMLRAHGLAPSELQLRATQALAALHSTLADPLGRWLLAPHPQAASEYAVSMLASDGSLATYRMDRVFRAGDAANAPGENFLWIVDYKISGHADDAGKAFFAAESEKHRSQLETYARAKYPALKDADGIRLAAFYPLRKTGEKLKVWKYEANKS
jgi:ATP-dependent exoDNAse (exonuclease V) beta subunit